MSAFLRLMGRFIASVTNPSVCAACLMLLFSASTVLAEVTVEVSITDRSFPAKPNGGRLNMFDLGEGGVCARAFKVIGTVDVHVKAPLVGNEVEEEINRTEPQLLKVGADGVIVHSAKIHKFAANGLMDSATMSCSIIRFTDAPRVDTRTEAEFSAMFRAKSNLLAFEGIWVDQLTKERVAFFEDPAQKGHYLGVQFDVANQKHVPPGLVVADLRLQEEGWLTGYVIFDDFTRYDVKMRMPAGDEFEIPIKKCTNGPATRAYPDRFPPEYQLMKVKYVRQGSK
jgi:hypothetical protein